MPPPDERVEEAHYQGARVIFEDDFDKYDMDANKWFPYYLPHWSGLAAAAARFSIGDSVLRLTIADNQKAWSPEFGGELKVSGIQTGHFAGSVGGALGQHRFRDDLRVCEAVTETRLFLPKYCLLEMKARAKLNPWNLAAMWLIGFEDSPEKSGEITVFEAFGDRVGTAASSIGRGVKKINDPMLVDEIDERALPIDVEDWHVYAVDWKPNGLNFYIDGKRITTSKQSPSYPMQIMLNFYELPHQSEGPGKQAWFDIDYVRAFERTA